MREGAAIHADDQVMIAGKRLHRCLVRAIAFVDAVRDVESGVTSHLTKVGQQQGGTGATVDVIVGENGNPFAPVDRLQKPGAGPVHIAQGSRIGQKIAQARGQERVAIVGGHAALGQQPAERQRMACLLGQGLCQPVVLGAGADPAPPRGRGSDIEEWWIAHGGNLRAVRGECHR